MSFAAAPCAGLVAATSGRQAAPTAVPAVPSSSRLVRQRVCSSGRVFTADRSSRRSGRPVCAAAGDAAPAKAAGGTPVPKNTILVVGGTGTLGRQVVRRALDEGYEVRCIVRPRLSPADFLRDWGATTVQADLTDPSSLPAALVGVSTVIDCATARPEESTDKIDWEGKVALIQSAQAMGIQRYIFCSILHCDKHPEVPLMNIKHCTEQFLAASGLNFTVFRICGFMQAIIGNYAVPILEEKPVWGTTDQTRTAYMDTQDVARLIMAALRTDAAVGRTLPLAGPKAWTNEEVIALCEELADCDAEVRNVPVWLLKGTRGILRSFQWATDAADRLAFAEVLSSNESFSADMAETYKLLGVDPASITSLEAYLKDYFTAILKKLKDVGATSKQTNFYISTMASSSKIKMPTKEVVANAEADGAKLEAVIESLREHASTTATVQLVYVILRTAWLVLIPQALGAPQFVPLAMEVLAAEIVLFLLFRAGGGFGPPSQERPRVLHMYSLLSVGILGKCTTDTYIYQLAPAMWKHFRPGQPWGVPTILALRLAPVVGIQAQTIQSALRFLELLVDAFCLLAIFRGIRTGKALLQARMKQKKAQQQKKKD